jgi:Tfp pilus assembly protein PilF
MSDASDDFQDFHDAVSQHSSRDEAEQQIRLARTCLEMGMADDAIKALTAAAGVPRHRFEACAMLGRLYRDRGDLPHAAEWFERAAGAPAPSAAEARQLLEDLKAVRAADRSGGD